MVQMASDIERLYIDEEVRDVFLQAYEEDYERKSDLACDVVDCGYLLPPVKCIMDIRFHKAMGVDGFIVTNNNSTDDTLEVLSRLKNEGLVLEIIDESDPTYQQEIWVDRMIKIAKKKYHATWVINADADEFYYSKDLNLKESIVKFPRLNAIKVESMFSFPEDIDNFFENPYFNTNPIKDFEYSYFYGGVTSI